VQCAVSKQTTLRFKYPPKQWSEQKALRWNNQWQHTKRQSEGERGHNLMRFLRGESVSECARFLDLFSFGAADAASSQNEFLWQRF